MPRRHFGGGTAERVHRAARSAPRDSSTRAGGSSRVHRAQALQRSDAAGQRGEKPTAAPASNSSEHRRADMRGVAGRTTRA
ncbi:hypothetical protein [Rhodanobacter sp. FW106-PBR-LB-2-11]|uniref:hypothetical protein n=1 Tax=Rhodanobacter sp. FW106-PBR-LB-2-11 TaxID=1524463 RepID=UPI0034E39E6E